MITFRIMLSTGKLLTVDGTAGPLSDFDAEHDDPADFAARIWRVIDNGGPIWLEGSDRVVYLNRAHVVYLAEVEA